jgi:predicted transcriptional regulator
MWEVRTQFSRPAAEMNCTDLEWSAVVCDTEAEAETWWQARTNGRSVARCVCVQFDPAGAVQRVQFR